MSIALLCPTRGRPERCKRMIESVKSTASSNVEILLGMADAKDLFDYKCTHEIKATDFPSVKDWSTVMSWNYLASEALDRSKNKLFMLASDDTIFATPGWDNALLEHYEKLENKIHVWSLQDSRDSEGTPHPIVSREYINAMGYFLPPVFLHWFVDSWTVEISKANGCFTHLKDYLLIHDKPSDKGKPDETHSRIRRMGWHERDRYVAETCRHFLEFEKQRLAKAMQ